jgi:hypothetical protein
MSNKTKKGKTSRPLPKPNRQISNSLARKSIILGLSDALQHAREHALYGCWLMNGWQDAGLTPVVVAREQEAGKLMFGVYMVDLYCLGVKDVYTRTDCSINTFQRDLPRMCMGEPIKCSVELAHEIIYGALEYAEKIGFEPHPDFKKQLADVMLDPPDAHPRNNHVTFGKDGKPFYVSGPYDDKFKISFVLSTLKRTCGEGNFNVLMGLDELGMFD